MQITISEQNIWLNCNHLYYFYIIAREGSITKASKILSLGLPTLSSQLKQLEASLGKELFYRKGNQLILTETGKVTMNFAQEMYSLAKLMGEAISTPTLEKNKIKLGIQSGVSKILTKNTFKAIRSIDNINVSVMEGRLEELLKKMKSNKVDLIISNDLQEIHNFSGFKTKSILKSPIVVCGHSKFAGLKKGFPHSLSQSPFVLPSSSSKLRKEIELYLKRHAVEVDIVGETRDISVQKLLAYDGVGLIFAPLSSMKDCFTSDFIEIGRLPKIEYENHLIYSDEVDDKSLVKKIVRLIE
jgi:LysR family transcriptional activator of nhaA